MASILKVNEIQNASGTSALSVDLSGNAAFTGDVQADGVYNQSGDNDSGLDLSTNDVVAVKTGNTERMRVDNAGNVGIGTSSPTFTSGYGGIHLANDYAEIHLTNSGSGSTATDGFKIQQNSGHNTYLWNYENAFIALGTNNAERMRIDASGSLLIGTTSIPDASSPSGAAFYANTLGRRQLILGSTSTGGGVTLVGFTNPNGTVGKITTSGSSTSYVTSSDYRLKTDAQPMTGASARVQALNPVNFEWIADNTRVDGFLAHEAQEVVPEAVTGTKDAMRDEQYEVTPAVYEDVVIPAVLDEEGNELEAERTEQRLVSEAVMGTRSVPDYQGIDQSKLVPLLTAALQESLTEIADLKTRVTALETPA